MTRGALSLRLLATSLAVFASLESADATSLYSVEIRQFVNPIASDQNATAASVSASTGPWSALAEAGAGAHRARATTIGCETAAGFQQVCNSIVADARGSDEIRLLATATAPNGTPVDVLFDWTLTGTVDGIGEWGVAAFLSLTGSSGTLGQGVFAFDTNGVTVQASQLSFLELKSFTATLIVGQTYTLGSRLVVSSAVRTCPFGSTSCNLALGIDVDFSNTAIVNATVATQGLGPLQLIGDSGRDYLVLVPEAEVVPLLAAIGGVFATARARRRVG